MILPTDAGAVVIGLVLDDPAPACELCGDTGRATFADPFLDGGLIDAACPCGGTPVHSQAAPNTGGV